MTWFDYEVPKEHVREVNGRFFHKFSIEQENQLVRLCLFLVRNSPRVGREPVFQIKNIVGHDEVSPGRKSDPGGSLSFGMNGLRDRVLREIKR
jgi:N-acetyl-anhydromuramyl-L-alanine amidase AmpD